MAVLSRAVTDALLARLATIGRPVGDARAPEAASLPYYILYPIPGGSADGPVTAPAADLDLVYQVTGVGESRAQAQWLSDRAVEALVYGVPPSLVGASVTGVSPEGLAGVERDDATGARPLFYAAPRFRVSLTPA